MSSERSGDCGVSAALSSGPSSEDTASSTRDSSAPRSSPAPPLARVLCAALYSPTSRSTTGATTCWRRAASAGADSPSSAYACRQCSAAACACPVRAAASAVARWPHTSLRAAAMRGSMARTNARSLPRCAWKDRRDTSPATRSSSRLRASRSPQLPPPASATPSPSSPSLLAAATSASSFSTLDATCARSCISSSSARPVATSLRRRRPALSAASSARTASPTTTSLSLSSMSGRLMRVTAPSTLARRVDSDT
mmetsp:Transcript_22159/g.56298  ORF Transcript_22159/g.56298 Transcript_22159/m.56298 type:complete len:254 (+) Transcript_22159:2005-2766(+)